MYVDRYNNLIKENSLLLFDNRSIFRFVKNEKTYFLKCITASLPLIKPDTITLDKCFSSVQLIDKIY